MILKGGVGLARKTKAQQLNEKKIRTGIFVIFFILGMLVAIFQLGFLGVILANILRFFSGEAYQFLAVLLGGGAVYYFLKIRKMKVRGDSKKPKHSANKKNFIGIIPFYLGLELFLHIQMFYQVAEKNPRIFRTPLGLWWRDFLDFKTTNDLGGGLLGGLLYSVTHFMVSQVGSYIIAIFAMLVGVFLVLPIDVHSFAKFSQRIGTFFQTIFVKKTYQEEVEDNLEIKRRFKFSISDKLNFTKKKFHDFFHLFYFSGLLEDEEETPELEHENSEDDVRSTPIIKNFSDMNKQKEDSFEKIENVQTESVISEDEELLDIKINEEAEDFSYVLPSTSLFSFIPEADQSIEQKTAEENVQKLERAFSSFGIEIRVTGVSIGPSVTKYELKPPIGVKVSRITSLTDDIALALAAKDVRMEAPIPGKSLIGIEIPNNRASMVSFRSMIEKGLIHSDQFLEVPLGRDISGEIQVMDLEKTPHVLIAGSTGSGKSVAVNGIISSILMKAKPNEVKLIMIDPKMVELSIYNGIPHLLTPVVTNPRKAAQALNKVVEEMERRYELFSKMNVRKISTYNEVVSQGNIENGANHPMMPLIVVIVDELADLMMVASKDVEEAIIRLGQKARAAGIHMVLATQRPSVDVISGLIKANVPSRIAFAVSSGTDSRTILDSNGAEKLLGRGDMLYKPIDANHPIRVQGAFVSDEDVERLVNFVKNQQKVHYNQQFNPGEISVNGRDSSKVENQHDDYFEDAKRLVIDEQTASASFIQRRFKTGYNRALRIVEELEEAGVIGPSVGTKPREVLVKSLPDDIKIRQEELLPEE